MKYWVIALVTAGIVVLALGIAVGLETADSQKPFGGLLQVQITGTPLSTQPQATAPYGCQTRDFGQCSGVAINAAIFANHSRYPVVPSSLQVFPSWVEWPDSCLGVYTPGVDCKQEITLGWIVILQSGDSPYVEYHTDMDGHAVFAGETDSPPPSE